MTLRVAILTVSDSAVAGTRADISGPALRQRCEELGWSVVAESLVPDEEPLIANSIARWADSQTTDLILTTGGTGIAHRDVTPEATRSILDREFPGISELLRAKGLEQTRFSVVSRAVAGNRGETLIVNLPGSPAGAVFSLEVIRQLIPHMVNLLHGKTAH